MSVISPEDWLPEYGLSQMDCIKASMTMAEFLVLASTDPSRDPKDIMQIAGSFVVACELSCKADELPIVMQIDLVSAGLEKIDAQDLAGKLSKADFLSEWVYSDLFIKEHRPKLGLYKTKKFTGFDPPKLVKAINKLGNRKQIHPLVTH